jgi:phenylacetate-CoA ligase
MSSSLEDFYFSSPVWLQNILVSIYGYNLYRKRYTGIYHDIIKLVRESRTWTQRKVEDYQCEKLFLMAKHCRQNIPYYQKLFANHGLHENNFTTLESLQQLPILSKQQLLQNIDAFCQPGTRPYMLQHTSGSTGTPLVLGVNEYTYKLAMALLVEHEEFNGVSFKAKRATFAGRMVQRSNNMLPPFSRINRAENQKLFSSYHLNDSTFPWYRKELDSFQPSEIIGYPSAICELAMCYEKHAQSPGFSPRAIITNSETLLSWQREKIERVFQCNVFDYYGTAEYVLFAGQGSKGTYRLNPIIGITEVLKEKHSDPPSGELIATSLTNYHMPLLRYNTGDIAEIPETSPSRTVTHSLLAIHGRKDDYIESTDGRKIGRMDHIFKGLKGIKEAQLIQHDIDRCSIILVKNTKSEEINEQQLKENFYARTGNTINLSIIYREKIPRGANGKFKSVIRENDNPNA